MDESRSLTVGAVARLAGVTVRTLHHYDEIGLLRPSGRTEAGYRRYTDADIERLQRILFFRELEFGLDDIRDSLADPDAGTLVHLRRQQSGPLGFKLAQGRRLQDRHVIAIVAIVARLFPGLAADVVAYAGNAFVMEVTHS